MRSIIHECPGAVHKSIDEVRDGVFEMLFGSKPEPTPEYRSGFQLDPAGTVREVHNRLEGNTTPSHFGYHECHLRARGMADNSRLRKMPFKVHI